MKKSHIIALSGISCALAFICEVGSIYVEFMTLTFAVLAAVFVSMPLTQNYWVGGILAYIATSIFSFLVGNINSLPFILFFGAYALIQWAIEQKLFPIIKNVFVKYSVGYLLKIAYFEVIVAIVYFCFKALIPPLILFGKTIELTYLILSLAGIPIFLLYDLMMHLLYTNFAYIVTRIVKKTSKTTTSDDIVIMSETNKKYDETFDKFAEVGSDEKNINHQTAVKSEEVKMEELHSSDNSNSADANNNCQDLVNDSTDKLENNAETNNDCQDIVIDGADKLENSADVNKNCQDLVNDSSDKMKKDTEDNNSATEI